MMSASDLPKLRGVPVGAVELKLDVGKEVSTTARTIPRIPFKIKPYKRTNSYKGEVTYVSHFAPSLAREPRCGSDTFPGVRLLAAVRALIARPNPSARHNSFRSV